VRGQAFDQGRISLGVDRTWVGEDRVRSRHLDSFLVVAKDDEETSLE
jgi:hypothetical protein